MSKEALRKSIIALELLESDARRLLKEIEVNGPLFAQKRVVMTKQAQFVVDALDECRRSQRSAQPEQRTLLRALRYAKMARR